MLKKCGPLWKIPMNALAINSIVQNSSSDLKKKNWILIYFSFLVYSNVCTNVWYIKQINQDNNNLGNYRSKNHTYLIPWLQHLYYK